jgi:hypothetical protein
LFVVAALLSPTPAIAQPFVESAAPPVIERGKSARVTFVGRNLAGAIGVWHSLGVGALKARPVESRADRAVFDIDASADAPVGVCGLRVATRDGLGNVILFLIDDLPLRPRDAGDAPTRLTLPAAVWGTFRDGGIDRYPIEVTAGQRVSFEAVANRFGKDADPLLTIRDANGKWVAERDNDQGLYYDFRFEHRFENAGRYSIEVRDARFRGSEHHHYVLRMGRFPPGRVALPSAVRPGHNALTLPEAGESAIPFELAPGRLPGPFFGVLRRPDDQGSVWLPLTTADGDVIVAHPRDPARERAQSLAAAPAVTFAFNLTPMRVNPFLSLDAFLPTGRMQATPAKVPGVMCGVLRKPGERQAFTFDLAKGQHVYVRGEAHALNSPVDLDVVLTDRFGRELRRGAESRDEVVLDYAAGTPGMYGLIVRDQLHDGGDAFTYRLTVSDTPFPPQLAAEVEGLTVPQGSYQPVPIVVTRNGTAGPIRLKLIDAPPGLTLTHDEIGEKETTIGCKLAADASTPLGLYSVQIMAESAGTRTLVRTQPLIDKQIINVDLIPLALREDQRRLPPSLTDRFAVQVTPPAPFTMELPESTVTLARYQHADVPVVTTRVSGFDGPVRLTATGGQLADKNEGRTRVYAEFPDATPQQPRVTGGIYSKILSNVGKSRIEVAATAEHQGRRVTLTRTFELNLTTAFTVKATPAQVSLLPGGSAKVRLRLDRVKSFDGPVTLRLTPTQGLTFPETVVVPKGQSGADVDVTAAADAGPRKQNLTVTATATVDGYEEEQRGTPFEVEIRKVEPPPKK